MTRKERIQQLVESKGVKYSFLANAVGLTNANLSYHLTKAQDISEELFLKLCEAIEGAEVAKNIISIDELELLTERCHLLTVENKRIRNKLTAYTNAIREILTLKLPKESLAIIQEVVDRHVKEQLEGRKN